MGYINMKPKIKTSIFVSYSWDSESHKEKVRRFVQDLRLNGIDVIYDGDLQLGDRLQHFMEDSIAKSDMVFFICTPNYKERADNRIAGVGYENNIISNELYESNNEQKFIPILFDGSWEASLPIWAKGKLGIDLSTQDLYESNYNKLLSQLKKHKLNVESTINTILQEETPDSKKKYTRIGRLFDVNTFVGLVFATIFSGVILSLISPLWSYLKSPASNDESTINDITVNDLDSNNIASDSSTLNDTHSNGAMHESITIGSSDLDDAISIDASSNNTEPDSAAFDTKPIDDIIPDNTMSDNNTLDDTTIHNIESNGTLPKGTTPIDTTLTEEKREQLAAIKKLSIGVSKDWVESNLGTPFVANIIEVTKDGRAWPHIDKSNIVGEVLEYIYIFEDVSIKIYFDVPGNSCKAFFVTILKDVKGIDIVMPDIYAPFVSNKPLGEFAYTEISGEPGLVYGYSSQGVARTFYGESYYYTASGNYQTFYFSTLDYGMLNSLSDFVLFISLIQHEIGPSNDVYGLPSSELLCQQRDKFYPNTYGISVLNDYLTFELFGSYAGFDSVPLRRLD